MYRIIQNFFYTLLYPPSVLDHRVLHHLASRVASMYITLLAWPRPSRQEYSPTFPFSFRSRAFASSTSYARYEFFSRAVGAESAPHGPHLRSVLSRLVLCIVQAAHAEPSRVIQTHALTHTHTPLRLRFPFGNPDPLRT